jgi:hypothetical protein
MQPMGNGPRRKDLRRTMHVTRETRPIRYRRGAYAVPVNPGPAGTVLPDYAAGHDQGRTDYPGGWYAIPAGASPAWARGYQHGYRHLSPVS